jgi:hypothetical protein
VEGRDEARAGLARSPRALFITLKSVGFMLGHGFEQGMIRLLKDYSEEFLAKVEPGEQLGSSGRYSSQPQPIGLTQLSQSLAHHPSPHPHLSCCHAVTAVIPLGVWTLSLLPGSCLQADDSSLNPRMLSSPLSLMESSLLRHLSTI